MDNVKTGVGGYMTVEAALVMAVVLMVYVFVIDSMILQYERCVEELEGARNVLVEKEETKISYDVKKLNPTKILRLQKMLEKN